ncbi:effector-associated constant component EACC1 [Nocardia sp. CA-107356]|uniref:effector-associated constant component EACC1 n=1 Tax=Nocardia sp. CA-107356 TaxID=3239972 RepID=UPI003D8D1990
MDTDLTLSIAGADTGWHMGELVRWLRAEPELRGKVTAADAVPNPGDMGSLVELATIAVGSGGVLSVLATSLKTWLAQPRHSDIHIEVRNVRGQSVIVDAERVADVAALLKVVFDTDG